MKDLIPKELLPPRVAVPTVQSDPQLDTLMTALESLNGLAIEVGSKANAVNFRHRLYRARKTAIVAGNVAFNNLTITIHPTTEDPRVWEVHIKKLQQLKIRQL